MSSQIIGRLALWFALLAVFSCGISDKQISYVMVEMPNKIYHESYAKFLEKGKEWEKELDLYSAKKKVFDKKYHNFLNSLSNQELEAFSKLAEASQKGDKAKHILAQRRFESLLCESPDQNKYFTLKQLGREGYELKKEYDALGKKLEELINDEKRLARLKQSIEKTSRDLEEERRHREMVSSVGSIRSSLEGLRFGLDQWKMQQWLFQMQN